jgi:DNA repair protein RecN (Recombination protein N)
MIKTLKIQNIALIQDLEIHFHPGFNVITGQSGAGKSLILSSLYLLRGDKASPHLIRTGESKALVIGAFVLSPAEALRTGLESEFEIRRELSKTSSKVFFNNKKIGFEELKKIGALLFDILHQSDSVLAFSEETQLEIVDEFAKILPLRESYQEHLKRWEQTKQQLHQRYSHLDPEVLAEEVEKLNQFNPSKEDYEQLEQERLRLENATFIRQQLGLAYEALYSQEDSILSQIGQVQKQIEEITSFGSNYAKILQQLTEAYCLLEETAYSVRDQDVEIDEMRLHEVQQRLKAYKEFLRKYTCTVDGLLEIWESLENQHHRYQKGISEREALVKQEKESYQKTLQLAKELHEKRCKAAGELCYSVEQQLRELGMNCRMEIKLDFKENALSCYGATQIDFLISTNKGEDLKPLSKIASGGERSRFILALKSLVDSQGLPIFVFDELDATLGNRFAREVGEKLRNLSKNHQVLSATHSPIIAAYGNKHLLVSKCNREEKTYTIVQEIQGEAKQQELLAMFQGEDGPLEVEMLQKILINH